MTSRSGPVWGALVAWVLVAASLTACTSGAPEAAETTVSTAPTAETTIPSFPPAPDIAWTEYYRETFDDAEAAAAWIWTGPHVPVIEDGQFTFETQSGQSGYNGIGADDTHVGFGGGADDDRLRTIRVTATVELSGVDQFGMTCLDLFSKGGYPSPSMYALVVSSSGARIWKIVDDEQMEVASIDAAGLPDPFAGAFRGTCAAVDGGYYLEVALDGDVVLATIDDGPIPDGRNARLYDAAGQVDVPRISYEEVMIEVPAS